MLHCVTLVPCDETDFRRTRAETDWQMLKLTEGREVINVTPVVSSNNAVSRLQSEHKVQNKIIMGCQRVSAYILSAAHGPRGGFERMSELSK